MAFLGRPWFEPVLEVYAGSTDRFLASLHGRPLTIARTQCRPMYLHKAMEGVLYEIMQFTMMSNNAIHSEVHSFPLQTACHIAASPERKEFNIDPKGNDKSSGIARHGTNKE